MFVENKTDKIIVFEEIFPIHKWIIEWYLFKKKEIYFIRLNISCCHSAWVKEHIEERRIKNIKSDFDLNEIEGTYYDMAFDNITIFSHLLKESKILPEIKKLYGAEDIELAFRKALNEKLARFYYLNYILSRLQDKYCVEEICFVPSNGVELHRTDGCEARDYFKFYKLAVRLGAEKFNTIKIKFPLWKIIGAHIKVFVKKVDIFIKIFGFLFWLCMRRCARAFKAYPLKETYKYAVMIVSPKRQFLNNIQKVDFLVDDVLIKRDEVVFISCDKNEDLKKEHKKYLTDNNLNHIGDLNAFISWKSIENAVPSCLFLLFQLREEGFVLEGSLKIIYYYVRWSSFADRYRIDHLITHADFNTQTIARNIILEKHGCRSHYYLDSVSFGYIFLKDDVNVKYRHNLFGFLYYDSLISWCDKAQDYFEQSGCKFKHYINLGCFWAEHLRLIQEGKIKSDLKKKLYLNGYKENMKLISVFDSTFNDDSLTTYMDGIGFLEKILKLLDDLPDIFVILKEKKPREFHPKFTHHFADILRIYTKLENHERCYCVNNYGNSSDVIAFSDLTVSFPFTSTTFEALSARKKAIWYDATGKFRGAFYDAIPGLVCHSYQELITRVRELLFNISEEGYNDYLDEYVQGNLESYLDGRAISRFREHVAGSNRDTQYFSLRKELKSV